ncbi:MAG: hypothetical protein ACLR7U_05255 [Ruthenibacterium lactatiformans]
MTCFTLCWACCPTCALIAALLVLRHFARAALSARFFRLACADPCRPPCAAVSFAVPVQDRPAPLSIPLPTAAVRQRRSPPPRQKAAAHSRRRPPGPVRLLPVPSAPAPAGLFAPARACCRLAGRRGAVPGRAPGCLWDVHVPSALAVPLADETLADACRAASAGACASTPWPAGYAHAGGPFASGCHLPEGAGLRADTLPYVLAHEARHRSAGDIPFQFVLAAACALHWFDLLVW